MDGGESRMDIEGGSGGSVTEGAAALADAGGTRGEGGEGGDEGGEGMVVGRRLRGIEERVLSTDGETDVETNAEQQPLIVISDEEEGVGEAARPSVAAVTRRSSRAPLAAKWRRDGAAPLPFHWLARRGRRLPRGLLVRPRAPWQRERLPIGVHGKRAGSEGAGRPDTR